VTAAGLGTLVRDSEAEQQFNQPKVRANTGIGAEV
jgi:hypothetical protein